MPSLAETVKFVMHAGPFIWPQFLLAWVVVFLTLAAAILLMVRRGARAERLRTLIDAILFWGCLNAVIGFLGQWSGLHKLAKVVVSADTVNPGMIIVGLGESLSTTVFGMFVLVVSGFLWFALRAVQTWRVAQPA